MVPAYPGSPGKRAVKRWCVCVCTGVVGWYRRAGPRSRATAAPVGRAPGARKPSSRAPLSRATTTAPVCLTRTARSRAPARPPSPDRSARPHREVTTACRETLTPGLTTLSNYRISYAELILCINVLVGSCCPALLNCIDVDVHTVVLLG